MDYSVKEIFFRRMGIPVFKRFIMNTIGKFLLTIKSGEKMPSYFVKNPYCEKSLKLTLRWLYFNEFVHLFLILICIWNGVSFWNRSYNDGVFYMVIIALFNLGLAFMQQYNRIRINRLISRLKDRNSNLHGFAE